MQWDYYAEESWEPVRAKSRKAKRHLFDHGREAIGGKHAPRRHASRSKEEREFGRSRLDH